MKMIKVPILVVLLLVFSLLVAIVFAYIQRAEAERQLKLAEVAMERALHAEKEAQQQRAIAEMAQAEATLQYARAMEAATASTKK